MEHPAPISWLEITSTCLVSSDRAHAKCSAICDGSLCAFWRFATREERARLASKLWNSRSRPSMLATATAQAAGSAVLRLALLRRRHPQQVEDEHCGDGNAHC